MSVKKSIKNIRLYNDEIIKIKYKRETLNSYSIN